ncbi:isochorismate synthase MenF [Streptomyces sp. NPDC059649]|uniref:isochorismate synthase n=1 Tax=Streptomyces sp. NPDC059649 TaxID=3346895 RepID=UPI00368B0F41
MESGDLGSWMLSTPRTVRTAGPGQTVAADPGPGQFARLARRAREELRRAADGQAVVGALPFDERTPAALTLTRIRTRRRPAHTCIGPPLPTAPPCGDPAYGEAVATAVAHCREGTLGKVVLARSLLLPGPGPDRLPAVLGRLRCQQPTAYVFRVELAPGLPGPPRLLFGASPELLLVRHGDRVLLNPLAGSAVRHPDRVRDRAAARALLASRKDRGEHAVVVAEVARRLGPLCTRLDVPAVPSLRATGQLWHLSTTLRARLRHPAPDALELAAALHPTPAVCGLPRGTARQLIEELEAGPRDYYTGLVGWMDGHGDGQWVIALRCAELSDRGLRLYAGAGVVADSTPDGELAETDAKLSTLLAALSPALPAPTRG